MALQPEGLINNRLVKWKCKCDCGNFTFSIVSNLLNGNTTSCGCYRIERIKETNRLDWGESSFNALYGKYKDSAKKRKHSFDLTKEQFKHLTQSNCFYCNSPPENASKHRQHWSHYIHNGIDRRDNKIGYTLDNCVSCCKKCNYAKHVQTEQDFLLWAFKLVKFQNEKNTA